MSKIDESIDEGKKDSLSNLIQKLLKRYHRWYFSPDKIKTWGGEKKEYKDLSEYSILDIEVELKKLKFEGKIKSLRNKKSNIIYRINDDEE